MTASACSARASSSSSPSSTGKTLPLRRGAIAARRVAFRRHGLPTDDYDSNLAIVDGVTFTKLDSFIAAMSALGWPWRATKALPILPRPLRDWLYDNVVKSQILAKSRDG
ncbi:DCC1-like thiol-disulfide oxidoreductase family protein [Mesorhizobium atlanticum]